MNSTQKQLCNAIKKDGAPCKRFPIKGKDYCFAHMKKKEAQSFLAIIYNFWVNYKPIVLLSVLLGLASALIEIFEYNPVSNFLSRYVYSFDKIKPSVVEIRPDITTDKIIYKDNKGFEITIKEDESGIDWDNCALKIYYKQQDQFSPIKGEIIKSSKKIVFTSSGELQYGEYLLEYVVSDKAQNKLTKSAPFIVIEQQPLFVSGYIQKYKESSKKDIFATFIGKRDYIQFYKVPDDVLIYIFKVGNGSNQLILRDIDFSLDTGIPIFNCTDFWTFKVDGIKHLSLPEADKRYLKGSGDVYVSQRHFSISEIKPFGRVEFALLLGIDEFTRKQIGSNRQIRFQMFGTYFWEGFGLKQKRSINGIELLAKL